MALTLDEVMAEINRIKEEYAEDPDSAALAISSFMVDNQVPEDLYRNAMSKSNEANYRSIAREALSPGQTGVEGDGTGIVNLTPIRSGEGQTYSLPDQYTLADVQVAGRPMMNETQLSQYLPYDPYSIEQRRAYELEGPRAVTFYDRILNRPVPVVSKGVDALGRPTTGIVMGDAALASSGEMDISGVFPSTGMNIESSGLGGTTVGLSGQQAVTAGLPPGNTTGTLLTTTGDEFTTVDGVKTADDVIGTTGGTPGTGDIFVTDDTGNVVGSTEGTACPIVAGVQFVTNSQGKCVHPATLATLDDDGDVVVTEGGDDEVIIVGGDPTLCPVIGGVQYVKDASGNCVAPTIVADPDPDPDPPLTKVCPDGSVVGINETCPIVDNRTQVQKDLQAIYLGSPNTEIAGQRISDYANAMGGLTSEELVNAINPVISQGGSGLIDPGAVITTAEVDEAVIAGNFPLAGTGSPVTTNLTDFYTPESATGQGAYTNLESAYRVLDEGARQGMTLDQIGASFGLDPARTNQVLTDVGIDPTTYATGAGILSLSSSPTALGSQLIQPAVASVQQNLASKYDPTTNPEYGRDLNTANQIITEGLAQGLNLDQIGASFGLDAETTRQVLSEVGVDTTKIPGFREGGPAVDTGDQGGGFFQSVGRGISGLARYAKDKMFGEVPEYMADTSEIRFSGRPGSEYREEYYGEGPTFEERLIREYGYPESPERPGSADFSRESRPTDRRDMPASSELLDARAHALGTALYGNEYGGEASTAMGVMGEEFDRTFDSASREDIAMDKRNNAVGRKIFRNAGIMNTTRDLTRMVDQEILDQLDRIMDRPREERRAESPKEGPDLYFSRLDPRTLDTTTDPRGIINAKTYSRHPGGN